MVLAGIAYAVLFSDPAENTTYENEIKLPSYAYTNPLTLKAYSFATEHPEILEQIPCYCGCGGIDHRFLRDCFINDDWTFSDHASFCDICVGETIKAQEYFQKSMTMKEIREKIDTEYSKYIEGKTNTPPVTGFYSPILVPGFSDTTTTVASPPSVDLSKYSLPDNFDSLGDALKITPEGVSRAYFANIKLLTGTELEMQYVISMSRDDGFYGKKVIGMYSADFSPTSWIEMHDLGYDNTNDATLRGKIEQGMKNIVYARPIIYGHNQNVDNVLKLMSDPDSMPTSYPEYMTLLETVDFENKGVAMVIKTPNSFSDMNYWSITEVNGRIELVKAYNVTDNKTIPAAFDKYDPEMKGNVLIIKVTGDYSTVHTEKDNIDAVART